MELNIMSDKKKSIILRLQDGDSAAFERIFESFYHRLYSFINQYVSDSETTKNILQDVFLILWEKKSILLDDSNLNAWLYTVAKNKALKYLRHKQYINNHIEISLLRQSENTLNASALESIDTSEFAFREIEKIIERTLNSLPEQVQEIFNLSRFENLKNREIAEKIGISEKTVEANITKSLKLLRGALKDYLPLVLYLF
jgi:RNA polymerase sigma-70 factor, ECF subfamily